MRWDNGASLAGVTRGIDLSAIDPDIRIQDDLFRHVNGPWLRSTDIPADRATAGAFMTLFDEAEKKVRSIVEACRDHRSTDEGSGSATADSRGAAQDRRPLCQLHG